MRALHKILFTALLLGISWGVHAADRVVFQLDWLPGGDKASLFAAQKRGFFASEGIEVVFQTGRGSADAVTKLGTGVADMGSAGLAALMQATAENGVPVKAVLSVYTKQPDSIFSVRGSGITSFKQLVGKTVATATFSSSNALWPVMLQSQGVDPASVKLLKADPSALAALLAQGKVDATINWITVSPVFISVFKQVGKELDILPWSTQGLNGYGWSILASERMIRERPDVVRRATRAIARGIAFALADPEGAAADLKSVYPETSLPEAVAELRASAPLIQNEISKRDGPGVFEARLLAETWSWVARSFSYPAGKIDPEKVVDRSFLPKP